MINQTLRTYPPCSDFPDRVSRKWARYHDPRCNVSVRLWRKWTLVIERKFVIITWSMESNLIGPIRSCDCNGPIRIDPIDHVTITNLFFVVQFVDWKQEQTKSQQNSQIKFKRTCKFAYIEIRSVKWKAEKYPKNGNGFVWPIGDYSIETTTWNSLQKHGESSGDKRSVN